MKTLTRDFSIDESTQQMYKAQRKALRHIQGDGLEQFSKLWDYTNILQLKNPYSVVNLKATISGLHLKYCLLASNLVLMSSYLSVGLLLVLMGVI